jgi:membrane-bound ClpP family serine protease
MSKLLDYLSEFLAHRKGLLPLIGIGFIVVNLLLQFILPYGGFLVETNLFLHVGLIVAIFGLMLAWAL